jgi:hypothetical protein
VVEQIGFEVEARDELVQPGMPRLEDLRVRSLSDDSEWIALAEGKRYTGGVSVNDLLKLGRFVKNFHQETNRYSPRTWYLANQLVGRDPGSRPPILRPNPNELAEFQRQGRHGDGHCRAVRASAPGRGRLRSTRRSRGGT